MIKACLWCGKQFDLNDLRKKYCSKECARHGRNKQNGKRNQNSRVNERKEWARKEAEYLNHLAHECGVDKLADYIYNNYNKKSK